MTTKSSSSEFLNNNTPIKSHTSISSKYLQTVTLEDWWLAKSDDGKRLCLDIRENPAKRIFSSAPIAVIYDLVTLKSADGINLLIKGIINNSRTQENGFSAEVCSRFLLGFPYDWKGVVDPCLGQESAGNGAPTSESSFDESKDVLSSLPNCLHGKENIGTVDHLFPVPGVPVNSVIRKDIHFDVLGNRRGNDVENSDMDISADLISSNPVLGDSSVEVPCHKQRFENEINHERKQGVLHALDGETVANDDELLSNEEEKLKGDGCNEPEENVESAGDDLCVLNAKAVKSADLDLLAAEGTSIVEVDSRVIEGTVETEDNYLSNKHDNLNNHSNPPVVNMVPPLNLKRSSDKFEIAKSTSKGDNKTFTNMKSEESENLSCSYDTGTDELVNDVPASISSHVKIADPYEASVAVPVDMLSTKLAEAKGVVTKGKVCCKKKKGTNSRSISGSPGSVSNPSSSDSDSAKEIMSSSNGRSTSSRIKILANNLKDDQPTNSKTQREREKVNSVFVGSDSVNSKVANTDGELGGTSTPDPPIVQLQGNIPEKRQLHDLYSKGGCQADFMQSSVLTGTVKKINCGSGIDGTESGELRNSCGSLNKVGDVKDASDLKEREESKHSQLGTGSKTTKKEVPPLPSSNSKNKKRCSGAGKRSDINHKHLRTGSKPEPPKAKMKLI